MRTRKYYMSVFYFVFGVALVNAWTLYKMHCEKIGVKIMFEHNEFRELLAIQLADAGDFKLSSPVYKKFVEKGVPRNIADPPTPRTPERQGTARGTPQMTQLRRSPRFRSAQPRIVRHSLQKVPLNDSGNPKQRTCAYKECPSKRKRNAAGTSISAKSNYLCPACDKGYCVICFTEAHFIG